MERNNKCDILKQPLILYVEQRWGSDFEYMFPMLKILMYTGNHKPSGLNSSKKWIYTKDLNAKILLEKNIIICAPNFDKISYQIYEIQPNCKTFHAIEFFELLDFDANDFANGRSIAISGTKNEIMNFKNSRPEFCDLFSIQKKDLLNMCINQSLKNYYIIVTGIYSETQKILTKFGLKEKYDFIYSDKFNEPMPSQLLKKVINSKSVKRPLCPQPFTHAYVMEDYLTCCCSDWLNVNLGVVYGESLNDKWRSSLAEVIRLSVLNGTYCFCNQKTCMKYAIPEVQEKERKLLTEKNNYNYPEYVQVNIDYSCNLYCTSCRNERYSIIDTDRELAELNRQHLVDSKWLENATETVFAGNGDPFYSEIYRSLIFNHLNKKRDSIMIISNGILFKEDEMLKLINGYKDIKVSISVDAATRKTYNKIRRGGNWITLMSNLQMLSKYRMRKLISWLAITMVVQRDNYNEIHDFINLGKKLNVDMIGFGNINDWGVYPENEFSEVCMINEDGSLKPELEFVLTHPLLNEPEVAADFFLNKL